MCVDTHDIDSENAIQYLTNRFIIARAFGIKSKLNLYQLQLTYNQVRA